ncbi:MAG: tetratricopeptide repeat protein [Deltaproteobacteria bacterium]|nr:tetratricopeptide repeat protein [Deltaproteobacteria bacterium]
MSDGNPRDPGDGKPTGVAGRPPPPPPSKPKAVGAPTPAPREPSRPIAVGGPKAPPPPPIAGARPPAPRPPVVTARDPARPSAVPAAPTKPITTTRTPAPNPPRAAAPSTIPRPVASAPSRPIATASPATSRAVAGSSSAPTPAPAPAAAKAERSRFRALHRLWRHPLGEVSAGTDATTGARISVMVLHAGATVPDAILESARTAARVAAGLAHAAVIRPVDVQRMADGRIAIATEPFEGTPLLNVARNQPLPVVRSVAILRQVCKVLAAAHDVGLVHRALTLGSLVLRAKTDRPDTVAVTDFGVGPLLEGEITILKEDAAQQPVSPERISGAQIDAREDLYMLGCIAYALFTGGPPFRTGTSDAVKRRHAIEDPMPIADRLKGTRGAPPAIAQWIHRCLAKEPDDRFADAAEAEAALCLAQIEAHVQTPWDDLPPPDVDAAIVTRITAGLRRGPATTAADDAYDDEVTIIRGPSHDALLEGQTTVVRGGEAEPIEEVSSQQIDVTRLDRDDTVVTHADDTVATASPRANEATAISRRDEIEGAIDDGPLDLEGALAQPTFATVPSMAPEPKPSPAPALEPPEAADRTMVSRIPSAPFDVPDLPGMAAADAVDRTLPALTAPSAPLQSSIPTLPGALPQSSIPTLPGASPQSSIPTLPGASPQSSIPTIPGAPLTSSTSTPPSAAAAEHPDAPSPAADVPPPSPEPNPITAPAFAAQVIAGSPSEAPGEAGPITAPAFAAQVIAASPSVAPPTSPPPAIVVAAIEPPAASEPPAPAITPPPFAAQVIAAPPVAAPPVAAPPVAAPPVAAPPVAAPPVVAIAPTLAQPLTTTGPLGPAPLPSHLAPPWPSSPSGLTGAYPSAGASMTDFDASMIAAIPGRNRGLWIALIVAGVAAAIVVAVVMMRPPDDAQPKQADGGGASEPATPAKTIVAAPKPPDDGVSDFAATPNDLAVAGDRALADGRGGDAEALYQRAIVREPRHLGALLGLGRVQLAAGDAEKAASYFRRAVGAHPNDGGARIALGDALVKQGNVTEARKQYKKAKSLKHPDAAAKLAAI